MFLRDVGAIALSIIVALLLLRTDILKDIIDSTKSFEILGSFIAGLFFTSVFTTAPAIVALAEISKLTPLWEVAVVGALGSAIGDCIIFRFIRDEFAEHIIEILSHKKEGRKVRAIFHALSKIRIFRWFTFLVGGLIIASPLPDELGISILGFSKMKLSWFIPISFFFNCLGIVIIGLVAASL